MFLVRVAICELAGAGNADDPASHFAGVTNGLLKWLRLALSKNVENILDL